MVQIENIKAVKAELRKLKTRYGNEPTPTVFVGFTQAYAIWVHETDADYRVGQWKFLSSAANDLKSELAKTVRNSMKAGATMLQAMLVAGFRLQAEAQERVPLDTSALKASAFTAVAAELEEESKRVHSTSEAIKKAAPPKSVRDANR